MKHNVRSTARWVLASLSVPLIALAVSGLSTGMLQAAGGFSYQVFNSYNLAGTGPANNVTGSEIVDILPNARFALSVGRNENRVGGPTGPKGYKLHVLSVSTSTGAKVTDLNIGAAFSAGTLGMTQPVASSVAIHPSGTYAIVTLREFDDTPVPPAVVTSGKAVFIIVDPNTGALTVTGAPSPLTLGVNPESIAIDPTGTFAVVANEGNLGSNNSAGPNGSISVIDLRGTISQTSVQQITTIGSLTNPAPEAVTISSKGQAFVSLQPNNAIAVVNVTVGPPLAATVAVQTLAGPHYPDGLTTTPDGNYLITANEGQAGAAGNPASTSLWSISGTTLTKVGTDYVHREDPANASSAKVNPEMVDVGLMFGAIKAFVSLERGNAVEVLTVTPAGLAIDERVNINPGNQVPFSGTDGLQPEGVSVVDRYVAVGSTRQANVSVIVVTGPGASPTPSGSASPSATPSGSASPSATPSASPSTPGGLIRRFLPFAQK